MDERLLMKCRNTIWADRVTEILAENSISSRVHDESDVQRNGAFGGDTGIAIYVLEKDFEVARSLTTEISKKMNKVEVTHSNDKFITIVSVVTIALFILPVCYWNYAKLTGHNSALNDTIALSGIALGLILFLVSNFILKKRKKK